MGCAWAWSPSLGRALETRLGSPLGASSVQGASALSLSLDHDLYYPSLDQLILQS